MALHEGTVRLRRLLNPDPLLAKRTESSADAGSVHICLVLGKRRTRGSLPRVPRQSQDQAP